MDFYKALGVSRAASKQEVRDAWRKQALENHPDRRVLICTRPRGNIYSLAVARLHVSGLSTTALTVARAHRLQGASDFEKQEALRKFNRAKEAYEVLGDGKPITYPRFAAIATIGTHPTCHAKTLMFLMHDNVRHVWRAESKRALYDSSGRSAVYAAERTGRSQSSPFRSAYAAPRTRTGWSNFWYQQQQYNTHGEVCSVIITREATRSLWP